MEGEIVSMYFNLDIFVALGLLVCFLSEDERQKLIVTEGYSVSEMFVFELCVKGIGEVLKGFS